MIAGDISDEIARMKAEHGRRTSRDILIGMGAAPEEIEGMIEVMINRTATVVRPGEDVLEASSIAWLDGFMIGVSLGRRRIALEGD